MPQRSNLNCHEGAAQRFSESAHVSIQKYCTLFPPNEDFTCFTISIFVGILFLQSQRARAFSLTTGLMSGFGPLTAMTRPQSLDREPKPHFNLLQAEVRD